MFDIIIYLFYRNPPAQNHSLQKFQKVSSIVQFSMTTKIYNVCIFPSPAIDLTLVDYSELKECVIIIIIR